MKNIKLGLDIGVNSIGWAVADMETQHLLQIGSRILPMDKDTLSKYETGNLQSAAADRTAFRSTRRLYERANKRRERLLRVLHQLHFLPPHYDAAIDFDQHPGQFKDHGQPLLAYAPTAAGKPQFIFEEAFQAMLQDFARTQPDWIAAGRKVPQDWTIYYLRHKALTQKIAPYELAWILLQFNTKRGYYPARATTEADTPKQQEEYRRITVAKVEEVPNSTTKKGKREWRVTDTEGRSYPYTTATAPCQAGEILELIVTTPLDKEGRPQLQKDGTPKISVRQPKEDDWQLVKKRTENEVAQSGKTVGSYIYHALLTQPEAKVRGQLIHTIDRHFYRDELVRILQTQSQFHPELRDRTLYETCLRELYRRNDAHVAHCLHRDFIYLLVDDLLFYQRPLKSKKSEIGTCALETYRYFQPDTQTWETRPARGIPKSHPLFEEFRLWQFLQNLQIYQRECWRDNRLCLDVNVTADLLPDDDAFARLFTYCREKKELTQPTILSFFHLKEKTHRWNFDEEKRQPACPTHSDMAKRMKALHLPPLTSPQEQHLWHILYSVTDFKELPRALDTFARRYQLPRPAFVEKFEQFPAFSSGYGAYSAKALRKLLPLLRCGEYWSADAFAPEVRQRLEKLLNGEADDHLCTAAREIAKDFTQLADFSRLPLWQATYLVYNRHSEAADLSRWSSPEDIDAFLQHQFKQHALRNPVVEKIVSETLRVVRDLWAKYGQIDEIHVEMARNLKQTKEQRQKATQRMQENESTNFRIRLLLQEFAKTDHQIQPNSPIQQEKFKIYENQILQQLQKTDKDYDFVQGFTKRFKNASQLPTPADIQKYRLWLDQKYRSPYTGRIIPLSQLFTREYEIEHVIPKSRYYDDSLSNKVICEAAVNKDKDRLLAYEYIMQRGGSLIQDVGGKTYALLTQEEYEKLVNDTFSRHPLKKKKLLLTEVPQQFNQTQLNNTRYITRVCLDLLSKVVRQPDEEERVAKRVIPTNGAITDLLKQDWGFHDIWNELVTPRFQRLNALTGTADYGAFDQKDGTTFFRSQVPLEWAKGFSKKRVDHRHHALDAVCILYADRAHIQLLNNEAAQSDAPELTQRLRQQLRENGKFKCPYPQLSADVKRLLSQTLVSFKQRVRLLTTTSNYYWTFNAQGKKVQVAQTKGDRRAIRQSLHKATLQGPIRLPEYTTLSCAKALEEWPHLTLRPVRRAIARLIETLGSSDPKVLHRHLKAQNYQLAGHDCRRLEVRRLPATPTHSATRVALDESFTLKKIQGITDSGIRTILERHLERHQGQPKSAFSPEGLQDLNSHLTELNGGRPHAPIYKVRMGEIIGLKFPVGTRGCKAQQLVEADKGTNLFFAIYANAAGERSFATIGLSEAIERTKQHLPVAPPTNEQGDRLLFTLSPNDLVYVPLPAAQGAITPPLSQDRIYRFVSATKNRSYFIPYAVASPIHEEYEMKGERDWTTESEGKGNMIRLSCIKLTVNRLGEITEITPSSC